MLNFFKGVISFFTVIILSVSGFFTNSKPVIKPSPVIMSPTPTITPTINISQNMTDSKQTLVDLEKALNVTAPLTNNRTFRYINWFIRNDEVVPLTGQGFSLATSAGPYTGKYGNYDNNKIVEITENALKPLQNTIDEFFLSNGFQKDDLNTFRSSKSYVLLFMGYIKEDLKCWIRIQPQSSSIGDFYCGIVNQTQLTWRKELTSAINTTKDPNIVVYVEKLIDNYASGGIGSVTGQGGGSAWYAVKIDGQWKEVSRGQQMTLTSCKSLHQYNFPKEIIDLGPPDSCSKYSQPKPTPKTQPNINSSLFLIKSLCFTPSSKDKPNINFNEEVTFDGSCTKNPSDDPITRYYWQFRDGDLSNFVTVEGKTVTHKFTKFAKTFSGGCGGNPWIAGSSGRGFEVGFCIDTKSGKGPCITSHYCPSSNDLTIVNLNNCMKNSNGQKDIDQCISELNL